MTKTQRQQTTEMSKRPRVVYLPAIDRTVTIGQYTKAVQTAIRNPQMEFRQGLTCWWPCRGTDIAKQFMDGVTERINSAIPYYARGTGKPFTKTNGCMTDRA